MGYDAICTFNGRTFDVPLLRDRFLMNRMDDSCLDKPHIDLLHMARRVFKLRLQRCNLGKLEEAVLGIPRFDDLPGAQVPQRFFDYLKTGNFDLLTDVLEHNAQDVASLCRAARRRWWKCTAHRKKCGTTRMCSQWAWRWNAFSMCRKRGSAIS